MAEGRTSREPRFRDEFRDFWRFVKRPRFAPRPPGRAAIDGWWADWFPSLSLRRLLQWALFLWGVNLFFLGPIAAAAATMGGAAHRLDIHHIPWLQALIWAPIVEELVFRYGLRHIAQAFWLVPAAVVALLFGPRWSTVILLAAILLICWLPYLTKGASARRGDGGAGTAPGDPATAAVQCRNELQPGRRGLFAKWLAYARRPLAWRHRLRYRRWFPWAFYLSSLVFAAVHLNNFSLHQTPYWLMPLLVLPQWLTGLVLGWLRVRRGIGASMLLHGLFNGGPLLVVWIVLHTVPQIVT